MAQPLTIHTQAFASAARANHTAATHRISKAVLPSSRLSTPGPPSVWCPTMPAASARARPAPRDNTGTLSKRERLALEYHDASEALRLDEVRRAKAKAACIAAGVLPDYEADPWPEGTVETVYAGKRVRIVLTVVTALERFDNVGFVADAEKLGIEPRKLNRLVAKHTTRLRPAHVFRSALVAPAAKRR
jgi:hypothetical protein